MASVYLRVRELQPGDDRGLGKVVSLWAKGWLPYTLRWQFTVTESDPPTDSAWRLKATSSVSGSGSLVAERTADAPAGPLTAVTYDWTVIAEKGVLKRLSFVMKPIFSANHHWAMARGEESLRLELARRHATSDPTVVAAIPAPPGPTFPHNMRMRRR